MAVDQVQLTPTHPPGFQTLQVEDHALQFCDYRLPYKELDNDLAMAIDIVQVELKVVSSDQILNHVERYYIISMYVVEDICPDLFILISP